MEGRPGLYGFQLTIRLPLNHRLHPSPPPPESIRISGALLHSFSVTQALLMPVGVFHASSGVHPSARKLERYTLFNGGTWVPAAGSEPDSFQGIAPLVDVARSVGCR